MAGVGIVIERHPGPILAYVTGRALFAEITVVIVVFKVTGNAGGIEFVGERVFAVAAITGFLGMLPIQRKLRITAMIKTCIGPVSRFMAVVTFLAAASVMRVILGMTSITGRVRISEGLIFVTIQAGNFPVASC